MERYEYDSSRYQIGRPAVLYYRPLAPPASRGGEWSHSLTRSHTPKAPAAHKGASAAWAIQDDDDDDDQYNYMANRVPLRQIADAALAEAPVAREAG